MDAGRKMAFPDHINIFSAVIKRVFFYTGGNLFFFFQAHFQE